MKQFIHWESRKMIVILAALLMGLVLSHGAHAADDTESCVKPAKGPIVSDSGKQAAPERMSMSMMAPAKPHARVGHEAPDFEANGYQDQGFKTVKLSDYRGKWVVLCFYPGDYTFVCPTELTAVAAIYPELKKMNVEVLSTSTDSRFVHMMWQKDELEKMLPGGVPYLMLADPGGKIGQVYGVFEDSAGVDIRGRFIIDPDGVIQAMEVLTPTVGRNPHELIRQIKAFQYVRETGRVTPSAWEPGDTTLKPSPSLVGNVWKEWKPTLPKQ